MQTLHDLKDEDLQGLAPEAIAALAQQMLQRLRQQHSEIRFKDAYFRGSWTAFQADRGRDFSVIVDGISN